MGIADMFPEKVSPELGEPANRSWVEGPLLEGGKREEEAFGDVWRKTGAGVEKDSKEIRSNLALGVTWTMS